MYSEKKHDRYQRLLKKLALVVSPQITGKLSDGLHQRLQEEISQHLFKGDFSKFHGPKETLVVWPYELLRSASVAIRDIRREIFVMPVAAGALNQAKGIAVAEGIFHEADFFLDILAETIFDNIAVQVIERYAELMSSPSNYVISVVPNLPVSEGKALMSKLSRVALPDSCVSPVQGAVEEPEKQEEQDEQDERRQQITSMYKFTENLKRMFNIRNGEENGK